MALKSRAKPTGPQVFTLQTLPVCDEPLDGGVAKVAGFALAKPGWRGELPA